MPIPKGLWHPNAQTSHDPMEQESTFYLPDHEWAQQPAHELSDLQPGLGVSGVCPSTCPIYTDVHGKRLSMGCHKSCTHGGGLLMVTPSNLNNQVVKAYILPMNLCKYTLACCSSCSIACSVAINTAFSSVYWPNLPFPAQVNVICCLELILATCHNLVEPSVHQIAS